MAKLITSVQHYTHCTYYTYTLLQARSPETITAFNTEALKLALQGVTIVVAAGSSGAVNDANMCKTSSGSADQGYWQV